jgi:AcrR family transcriptional regulator
MGSVAERARISKLTIYRLFEDKGHLIMEVAAASVSRFSGDLSSILHSGRSFKQVIREIVDLMIEEESRRSVNALLRLAVSERSRFPSIARQVLEQTSVLLEPLAKYLKTHARNRGLTEQEAQRFAFHLMTMATGGFGALVVDLKTVFGDRATWVNSVTDLFIRYFEPDEGLSRGRGLGPA